MDERRKTKIRRRDVLIAVTASGVAAAMGATAASSPDTSRARKRRAQYQPNSPEIQTFYRVNRYPAKS